MARLIRFGVSFQRDLLRQFDDYLKEKKYTNRSEAIRDLIRESLVRKEWQENREVAGAIILVYSHHKRELVNRLMNIQHNYHDNILSTQHLHLDCDNCLEIIATRGKAKQIEELYEELKSVKGVKHASSTKATTGSKVS